MDPGPLTKPFTERHFKLVLYLAEMITFSLSIFMARVSGFAGWSDSHGQRDYSSYQGSN